MTILIHSFLFLFFLFAMFQPIMCINEYPNIPRLYVQSMHANANKSSCQVRENNSADDMFLRQPTPSAADVTTTNYETSDMVKK